ncbi:hypothetical protein BOO71_0012808 [Deinococcus marmoris]|uniref:Uncharacterized protein n=1 Tax=Deinococcus marmoris TaxID=249408 RepID=A0A1U7NT94_9DEIO|nr:hypothetical protein BOO71_0012808 [Deinococcus marmoris]
MGEYDVPEVIHTDQLYETAGDEPCTLVQVFQTCAVTKN